MNLDIIVILSVLASVFGIIGGVMVFLNLYEGYRPFPGIPKKRRIIMSLEMAGIALLVIAGTAVILYLVFDG